MNPDILEESWNFSLCNEFEDHACTIYEYLWEIKEIREAFIGWKTAHPEMLVELKKTNLRKFDSASLYWEDLPNLPTLYLNKWLENRPKELQKLPFESITLLLLCADCFPIIHWLQLGPSLRRLTLGAWYPEKAVYHMDDVSGLVLQKHKSTRNMQHIVRAETPSSEGEAEDAKPTLSLLARFAPVREERFLIDWTMSKEAIKKELFEIIEQMLPAFPENVIKFPVTKKRGNTTRTDEHRLRHLAALRLMSHFDNDWSRCTRLSKSSWHPWIPASSKHKKKSGRKEDDTQPIFESGNQWKRAAHCAEEEILKLKRLFLG